MNTNVVSNPFNMPINAYAAFDAASLKSLMIQRLNEGGVFTDQIYEGSNFNSLLDIIAYSYNVLLFYLNKTASENSFSQAQLYENVNRIVKILGYDPIGYQTSLLSFNATGTEALSAGLYTIPRYSYFTVNGIPYTFVEDVTFQKNTNNLEELETFSETTLLHQGLMVPYPVYIANGEPFEEFSIALTSEDGQGDKIDHNNIHIYVTNKNGIYEKWKRVPNLHLESSTSNSFECRLNENQIYVLKFGNNVYGTQLTPGSNVSVFYLRTDGEIGEIGANLLNGNKLFFYNQPLFNRIFLDTQTTATYINSDQINSLIFRNNTPSTKFSSLETSTSIKQNASNFFKTQYRAITTEDYEAFLKNNFSYLLNDVAVLNNWEYLAEHVRYLYNLGLKSPNNDSRVLYNQVNFADSCDFNNIYIYAVPKLKNSSIFSNTIRNNYLNSALKEKIINTLQNIKSACSEIIVMDPVYIGVDLGVASLDEISNYQLTPEISDETILLISKSAVSKNSDLNIASQVSNILTNYFSVENCKLGQVIDINFLNASILSIEGVTGVKTQRIINDNPTTQNGISLLAYNPVYSNPTEDISIITQNISLARFKIPYFLNANKLAAKIKVIPDSLDQDTSLREY